jgi:hypothetical protein
MRIWHRYLGFFLTGMMAIYAFSGIIMIFRNTDFLKQNKLVKQKLASGLQGEALGRALRSRDFKVESEKGDIIFFKQGTYNKATGEAQLTIKSWPQAIEKLTQLHKANTDSPLFYLNVFFGMSLLFFVLSSFWMFMPGTTIFRRGIYFVMAGVVLTIIMLFV